MFNRLSKFSAIASLFLIAGSACSRVDVQTANMVTEANAVPTTAPRATPSKSITATDVAKLKWIEGTWRGMDGDKPFFERYRFDGTTMIVEKLTDETLSKVEDTSRFELKDGEFGHTEGNRRSAASSITADAVQFVPAAGGGNSFRFERQPDGTWKAVLEWPASTNRPAGQKIYRMEPWPPRAK